MFLQRLSNRLLSTSTVPVLNIQSLRALNVLLGKTETELVDKWKQKFAHENISEIETSIKHILDHVIGKDKVC